MSELVTDCPRCASTKITFDLLASTKVGQQHGWKDWYEAFCVCRNCHKSTIFVLSAVGMAEGAAIAKLGLEKITVAVNNFLRVERYITARDRANTPPPDYLPENIRLAFEEGSMCLSVKCFNAAGTMFSRPLKKAPVDAGLGQYDLKRSANDADEDDERQPRLPGGDVGDV